MTSGGISTRRSRIGRPIAGLAVLAVAGLLAASQALAQTAQPARSKPFRVVTTFTVIQDIAQNVAGTSAIVESITKPGAEIHDYQPTPLDVVKAQHADLVLWNGMNLERWFEQFFQNVKDVPSVVATRGRHPMGIAEGPYTGKPNPHAWMSPSNALLYVENIRKAPRQVRPGQRRAYAKNAAAYAAQIKAIDDPLRKRLSAIPEGQRWLVTSEGAFSYLARDYGLHELYLWPINADEQGTPQQIRRVIDTVRKHKCLSCSARARFPTSPPARSPRRLAPSMAACSTSIRSATSAGRCRPISSCWK